MAPTKEQIDKAIEVIMTHPGELGFGLYYSRANDCFCSLGALASSVGWVPNSGTMDMARVVIQDVFGLTIDQQEALAHVNDTRPPSIRRQDVIKFLRTIPVQETANGPQ